jgi:hypothetical protein
METLYLLQKLEEDQGQELVPKSFSNIDINSGYQHVSIE